MDWVLGNINKLLLILLAVIITCSYVCGGVLIRDMGFFILYYLQVLRFPLKLYFSLRLNDSGQNK